ncbi:hypothetical protein B0H19DRAFT_1234540 [Mycena capillaripes]|nr:hypothetical protein B0H19DRAFT_1234540 [Mycena capillaripes]
MMISRILLSEQYKIKSQQILSITATMKFISSTIIALTLPAFVVLPVGADLLEKRSEKCKIVGDGSRCRRSPVYPPILLANSRLGRLPRSAASPGRQRGWINRLGQDYHHCQWKSGYLLRFGYAGRPPMPGRDSRMCLMRRETVPIYGENGTNEMPFFNCGTQLATCDFSEPISSSTEKAEGQQLVRPAPRSGSVRRDSDATHKAITIPGTC